jgi:nitrite reductase/ring-hydroxylating ferredoxin subunit
MTDGVGRPRGEGTRDTAGAAFWAAVRQLLYGSWHPVALVGEFSRPGDYRSREVADVPVIVARHGDRLLVYRNSCPHQNFPIVGRQNTAGNTTRFVCPWHGWAFALDGSRRRYGAGGRPPAPCGVGCPADAPGSEDLFRLTTLVAGGVVWTALAQPAMPAPWIDFSVESVSPPTRLTAAISWRELMGRLEGRPGRRLTASSVLISSGAERRRSLVAVTPRTPQRSQLIAWADTEDGSPTSSIQQQRFLGEIASSVDQFRETHWG